MRGALLAGGALALAGCVSQQVTTIAATPPDDLLMCRETRQVPLPPPAPRTPDQLMAWVRRLQAASLTNAANLDVCRDRLERLNDWLRERP